MLEDYISRVTGEADVKKILIVGGAGKEQFGPFPDTISLLETGILINMVFLKLVLQVIQKEVLILQIKRSKRPFF